jgi:dehydrogenase/reductase SDR family member 7B
LIINACKKNACHNRYSPLKFEVKITALKNYFQGKIIWVTGASSGIGEALVYALANEGAHLIISGRRVEELERVQKQCAHPERVHPLPLDLSSPESVARAIDECYRSHPRIDMLFNNGGISQRAEALETELSVVRAVMEIDFFSNIALSRAVALRMKEQGGGHLVITSSLMGKWGFYLRSGYAAAKHALHGYYDSMRMEVERFNIQITLLTPGFIASDISKHALNNQGVATGEMDNNQASGMSVTVCAQKILAGVAAGKTEFGIGGKELLGLKLRRFVPALFEKILRKQSAR